MTNKHCADVKPPRIVLLKTFHPGNIGAVARAMKTMGLTELYLVNPRCFPDDEATSRAAGAIDVLEAAVVVSSLEEAVSDCTQVFGTTARLERSYDRPKKSCDDAIEWMIERTGEKHAIVFGRERMGLTSADIELCQQLIYIEGNPEYDILNMASAVQIICYEYFKQARKFNKSEGAVSRLQAGENTAGFPEQQDLENLYSHLQQTLSRIGFLRKKHSGETMQRFKQLFSRANITAKEVSMLRGVLSSMEWSLDKVSEKNNKIFLESKD